MTTLKWFGQRDDDGQPDVYIYESLPEEFRGKVRFAVMDSLERIERCNHRADTYDLVGNMVSRALGRNAAFGKPGVDLFLTNAPDFDFLRGLEAILECVTRLASVLDVGEVWSELSDLTKDLNKLLGHHHIGYRIEVLNAPREDEPLLQVIKISSEYTHREIVKPALSALQLEGFQTASAQFSDALLEYSEGNFADAITDANSAFESVLKRVLDRKKGNAQQLIRQAQKEGYFPAYLEGRIAHFADLLEALPVVRCQEGDAHGRLEGGTDIERFARYAIHLAAANIIFIMDEYNRRKSAQ